MFTNTYTSSNPAEGTTKYFLCKPDSSYILYRALDLVQVVLHLYQRCQCGFRTTKTFDNSVVGKCSAPRMLML